MLPPRRRERRGRRLPRSPRGRAELPLNFFLGALTLFTLGATAVAFTSLFFVEFRIFKKKNFLIKSLYCFWIPLRHHRFQLSETHPFEIIHFYGSPNMARLEKHPGMQGHQNRGHFELYVSSLFALFFTHK